MGLELAWDCALLAGGKIVPGFAGLEPSCTWIALATVLTLVIWWLWFLLSSGFL